MPGLDLRDLEAILEKSAATNLKRNITGCLIYHNDRFVQVLEGEKKDVLYVYAKIRADDRHHTVTLLWKNQVVGRFFEEWNMAFYRPGNENEKLFVNNLILLSELSEKTSGSLLSFWSSVKRILRDDTHKLG